MSKPPYHPSPKRFNPSFETEHAHLYPNVSSSTSANNTTLIHFTISDEEYHLFFQESADAMGKKPEPTVITSPPIAQAQKPKASWMYIPPDSTTASAGNGTPRKSTQAAGVPGTIARCPIPTCPFITTTRPAYNAHIKDVHGLKVVRVSDFFPCPHPKCLGVKHPHYDVNERYNTPIQQRCSHQMIVHIDYPSSHRNLT